MHLTRLIVVCTFLIAISLPGCITVEDQPANCSAPAGQSGIDLGIKPETTEVPLGPISEEDPEQSSSSKPIPLTASNPSLVSDEGAAAASPPSPETPIQPQTPERIGYRPPAKPTSQPAAQPYVPEPDEPEMTAAGSQLPSDPFAAPSTQAIVKPSSQSAAVVAIADQQEAQAAPAKQPTASTTSTWVPQSSQYVQSPIKPSQLDLETIYVYPVKRVKEGQRVSFPDLNATDPDGDILTYYFDPPLNVYGEWQTKRGDAGMYFTNISVTDGKNLTVQTIIIIVEPINRPPIIVPIRPIIVQEGQVVRINPKILDPDNDTLSVTISGWKDKFPHTTTYDDAGDHVVIITADDGWATTTITANISVRNVNRGPTLSPIGNITITEGGLVSLNPHATDPDGDKLTYRYTPPLDASGRWQTSKGDIGSYPVTVTVSDGSLNARQYLVIRVEKGHDPPVLEGVKDIDAKEGQTITAEITAYSPEGRNVSIRFSGFMDGPIKHLGYDDQGSHDVRVSANDGMSSSESSFKVNVQEVNRPPIFTPESFQ